MKKTKLGKRIAAASIALLLFVSLAIPATASSSLPWKDAAAHGVNEPSVRGYTAQQLIDWSPEEQPFAELLRSRIPLQERIDDFAATQADPTMSSDVTLLSVMGDYGDSFMDNPAYTNKFGVYTFNFWQYLDYISYWHGTATAYENRELYDPTLDWTERWFEIGFLNIPNPAWTDAAHKNGVLSLGQVFFSDNDRGQLTYQQMLVEDENGNFPVAEKLIEIAGYYGFDGYFFNQEETGQRNGAAGSFNVKVEDIPRYRRFMSTMVEAGMYLNWYDAVGPTGSNSFARTINNNNFDWLYNRNTNEVVSNSFFLDYTTSNGGVSGIQSFLDQMNAQYGTSYTTREVAMAGIEGGRDKFKSAQRSYISGQLNTPTGQPYGSIAILGTDFVHHELDSDLNHNDQGLASVAYRYSNAWQWASTARERLWWSGPAIDPTNTGFASRASALDTAVGANGTNWPGVADFITERSVVGERNFYTTFNVGRGLRWYENGAVSNTSEWSNISIQDIPVTWQWWQDTAGTDLLVDYDYGTGYGLGTANYTFADYTQIGGYNGGSSLVVNGTLDAENFLRLYKTEIALNENHEFELAYNKTSANDSSTIGLGLIFQSDPDTVVKVPVVTSGNKTNGWQTVTADLSAYADEVIAAFGLVFDPGSGGSIADWQVNFGGLRISDGSAATPAAPTGLAIQEAFEGTGEMYLEWNLDHSFDDVKQYNIYVNDTFVGAKYDEVYYIKQMPATSGTISVVPIGADGKKGQAATLPFNLNGMGVSDLTATSYDDGEFVVNWRGAGASGNVTVEVETRWHLMGEPVLATQSVSARGGTATFADMPTNGDYFTVRLYKDGQDSLSITGAFIDVACDPYDGAFSWNGNTLYLPMATTRDWRYMHVYENGVEKPFIATYKWTNYPQIIRGRSSKACLNFTSSANLVTIVMEDYSGNRSEPVVLRDKEVDETFFPDAALLAWVRDNAATKVSELAAFTGTIDLEGLGVADFTGLNQLSGATGLSLAGYTALTTLDGIPFPTGLTSLDLSGTGLTAIRENQLSGLANLASLDVSGMADLAFLSLNGLGLEHLVADPADSLPNLLYVDLRGTYIDMSAGTAERAFADYLELNQLERGATVVFPQSGNMALRTSVIQSSPSMSNSGRLTDGSYSGYTSQNVGSARTGSFVLDLGRDVDLTGYKIDFDGTLYGAQNFVFELSSDNETYTQVLSVSGNTAEVVQGDLDTPATGRYLRATFTNCRNNSLDINELELYGIYDIVHDAAVLYDGWTEPDPAPLAALIEALAAKKAADYTPSTWAPFTEAIEAAKAALDYTDPTITKREIAQHTAALNAADAQLARTGDAQFLYDWAAFRWNLLKDSADNYSVSTWNAFADAIENALALSEKGAELTLAEQEAAIEAIEASITGLVKQNKARLAQWIGMAETLLAGAGDDAYFESAVARLTEVLGRANVVMADGEATQAAIDAMVAELADAMQQMLKHGNRRSLELLVGMADTLSEADYRTDSWTALSSALQDAKTLLAETELTQLQIDDAYATLRDALFGLVGRSDFEELDKEIALAEKILADSDLYAPASIEGLQAALDAAKAVRANADATQSEIDTARGALAAKTGLARLKAKKAELESAITTARALKVELYTTASVKALNGALNEADAVMKDQNATQAAVDAARTNVLAKIVALKLKAAEVTTPQTPVAEDTQDTVERRQVTINPRAGLTGGGNGVNALTITPVGGTEADAPQEAADAPRAADDAADGEVQAKPEAEVLPGAQTPLAAAEESPDAFNPATLVWPVTLLLLAAIVVFGIRRKKQPVNAEETETPDK